MTAPVEQSVERAVQQPAVRALADWAATAELGTPLHLFCPSPIAEALQRLRAELPAAISYAVKANPHPLMLDAVRDAVDEFNVSNVSHLLMLREAGIDADRIAFVNPVVESAALDTALEAGVDRFVVDDERGLVLLLARAAAHGLPPRVTLRLRPAHAGQATHSVIRFGTDVGSLTGLAELAVHRGATVEALSFFVGTHGADMGRATPFARALAEIGAARRQLGARGVAIGTVVIGGGFPGARRAFHREHPGYFSAIAEHAERAGLGDARLVCEPGRFLAEPSLAMLARVVADRTIDGRRTTHLDVSGYGGLFETTYIDRGGQDLDIVTDASGAPAPTQLLGPIMDSFDVLKRDALLPPLATGDPVLLPSTGAYSFQYTTTTEGTRAPRVHPAPPGLDRALAQRWSL